MAQGREGLTPSTHLATEPGYHESPHPPPCQGKDVASPPWELSLTHGLTPVGSREPQADAGL